MNLGVSWDPEDGTRLRRVLEQYRNQPRTEPCVCGGRISALPGREAEAVVAHQRNSRHQQWFRDSGWEGG